MIQLFDNATGRPLGTITEAELKFLIDMLEEESREDTDYYLNSDMLDLLEDDGADSNLVKRLREAMGDADELEFRWQRA